MGIMEKIIGKKGKIHEIEDKIREHQRSPREVEGRAEAQKLYDECRFDLNNRYESMMEQDRRSTQQDMEKALIILKADNELKQAWEHKRLNLANEKNEVLKQVEWFIGYKKELLTKHYRDMVEQVSKLLRSAKEQESNAKNEMFSFTNAQQNIDAKIQELRDKLQQTPDKDKYLIEAEITLLETQKTHNVNNLFPRAQEYIKDQSKSAKDMQRQAIALKGTYYDSLDFCNQQLVELCGSPKVKGVLTNYCQLEKEIEQSREVEA